MSEFLNFLEDKKRWSYRTFGEGYKLEKICKHIEAELVEVRQTPTDLYEWVDLILLALDGALRVAKSPMAVLVAIYKKHQINVDRRWDNTGLDHPSFHKED